MAFGSFLVAIFETIRMIVDYLAHKAVKESKGNILVRCACCIAQCCARCFEKCVKFITSEAYVFTVLLCAHPLVKPLHLLVRIWVELAF
jgi:hypothetical protein